MKTQPVYRDETMDRYEMLRSYNTDIVKYKYLTRLSHGNGKIFRFSTSFNANLVTKQKHYLSNVTKWINATNVVGG